MEVQRGVQSVFRAANERLRSRLGVGRRSRPVICECSDANCMALLDIPLGDYERIRSDGHFVIAPGHEIDEIEEVVATRENYLVVTKN